ncbi:hypothetical protein [Cellulomonas sp.]|uniref:hypothetical protein n=1 Tax=Cellulomonas sp. TaxID=40001 RepID=UPI001B1A70C3|nr:hypothetical protein [Cellulomonas sp.]MBO9555898.1 hypothetical protein [Cellulomonas sp.]
MRRRPAQRSFADIVREVESTPRQPLEAPAAGTLVDGVLTDPDGREYRRVEDTLTANRALALAAAGAVVVWDSCGCGGYCGFEWFSAQDVKAMAASGAPVIRNTKRARGNVSEWRSRSGDVLLLAEDDVRWAGRMG